ncbi:MAG: DUF4132 domain-containing protein [Thermosynechococcaceae cyanobacterium]
MESRTSQNPVNIVRSLNLNPEDWLWATYLPHAPLPRPEPKPFNREEAIARLEQVISDKPTYHWRWSEANISVSLSHEESLFWLKEIISAIKTSKSGLYDERMANKELYQYIENTFSHDELSVDISPDFVVELLSILPIYTCPPELILPLANLFSTPTLIAILSDNRLFQSQPPPPHLTNIYKNFIYRKLDWRIIGNLVKGFRQYVLPYLSQEEIKALHPQLKSKLSPSNWQPYPHVLNACDHLGLFLLGSYLGMHDEMRSLIESWPDGFCHRDSSGLAQDLVFGLGDPQLVEHHMRRLQCRLGRPEPIRGWLVHTQYAALDYLRDNAFAEFTSPHSILEGFHLVKAPEAAPYVLELMLAFKAPGMARQWLRENPEQAIAGLIPVAAGTGRLAEAAQAFLHGMNRKGYRAWIQDCLEQENEMIAVKVRTLILDVAEIPFDEKTTPEWLTQALAQTSLSKKTKLPTWLEIVELSPLKLGPYCLNPAQTQTVLLALKQSTLAEPHPLIGVLKSHLSASTLEAFAWSLFESWLYEDAAPAKENWTLIAVGLLGQDASVFKLAPFIRLWPGLSHHKRAVLGLECLRTIGTDTALMQIYSIGQTVRFKGLKTKAQECMEAIAQSRNLTRDQLEDRIVPDCDLDERGSRNFDYGPRQFSVVLGAELQPLIRDSKGALKPNLPKPSAKDDVEKAAQAIADWKLLKKQIQDVTKTQSDRLKRAMIEGRRWSLEEFEPLLVRHPLMTNLAQRLVWGSFDTVGQLLATFRVTEDGTYADIEDKNIVLPQVVRIGVLHPAQISSESRAIWGERLSDYEIFQPFRQLNRRIQTLESTEIEQNMITRFQGMPVTGMITAAILKKAQWIHFTNEDRRCFGHYKIFPYAGVTAVLEYPANFASSPNSEFTELDRCFFVLNQMSETDLEDKNALILGTVAPVVISETLRTFGAIIIASEKER